MGILPANALTAASDTPAESGSPGPGEMTSRSGPSASMPDTSILSLRTTRVSTPSDSMACERL